MLSRDLSDLNMSLTKFAFSDYGIDIVIAEDEVHEKAELWVEHPKSGLIKKLLSPVAEVKGQWLVPFIYLERTGTYQFRYVSEASGINRILGGRFASSVTREEDRLIAQHFFQQSAKLYRANLYVPFTRKSVRLKVEAASSPPFSLHNFDILKLSSVKKKGDAIVLRGAAIVTGRKSELLSPWLDFRNLSGDLVYSLQGERVARPGMRKTYGNDYLWSGFKFDIPLSSVQQLKELRAPVRLNCSVRMIEASGTSYTKPLIAAPADVGSKTRTLCKFEPWAKRERISIISAEANNQIVFQNRKLPRSSSLEIKMKEWLALRLHSLLGRPRTRTWLFFEFEAQAAQDNAIVLFRHVKNNRKDIRAKYLIDRKSKDLINLSDVKGSVVYKYSFRHYWNLLTASVLISSQSKFHGYKLGPPKNAEFTKRIIAKPFVFLQHGVIGLKKIGFHRSNYRVATDLFFSSTKYEQEIICSEFGYAEHEVPLVGLPRFDLLRDISSQHKEILIMPTWRKSLQNVNEEEFRKSGFYQKYISLFRNETLIEYCKKNGFTLKFYLHPLISQHIEAFRDLSPIVKLISSGQEDVRDLLMKASILITDYSSVAWDFLYMKKPVVFYQFDLEQYNKEHGGFFDLKRELGELSIADAAAVAHRVVDWLDGLPVTLPSINQFAYYDSQNCSRALEVIESLIARKTI